MIGIVLGLGIVFTYFRSSSQKTVYVTEAMPATPSSSPLPVINQETQKTATSWPSPDGKIFLTMKTEPAADAGTNYIFQVSPNATESGLLVFSKTEPVSTTLTIPFNTWSPDNKYFFIQEHDGTQTKSLVFKATGELFSENEPFLDVNTLFEGKKSGFILGEVTGWAAPTLLIVNTKSVDEKTGELQSGPSFWFEITRKSLTRLSNTFP